MRLDMWAPWLLVALALSGCMSKPAGGGTGDADDQGGLQAHDVDIAGFAFSPADLSITVGDTVRWSNQDGATHTVDSTDGGPLDSGNMAQGATYSFTFDAAGTYDYRCDIHPSMTGAVTVVEG